MKCIIKAFALLFSLNLMSGCFQNQITERMKNRAPLAQGQHNKGVGMIDATPTPTFTPIEDLVAPLSSVGIRDHRQLTHLYSKVTGVSIPVGHESSEAMRRMLPNTNDLNQLNSPALRDVVELAAQYCLAMTMDPKSRRSELFPGLVWGQHMTRESWTEESRRASVLALTAAFQAGRVPPSEEVTELLSAIEQTGPGINSPTSSVCVLIAASPRTLAF